MTLPKKTNTQLTKQEFDEMVALKNAIHELPQAVSPEKMEEFVEKIKSIKLFRIWDSILFHQNNFKFKQ